MGRAFSTVRNMSDRNGRYFTEGCRVRDLYSGKYGVMEGYLAGQPTLRIAVRFDNEAAVTGVRPVCLEVLGSKAVM